ncbi:uncharacterized protein DUF397 [Haloactinospora alba]|uniref:Uncharacterized protein DUF397 n=1 Tax=Haloactinospora alba TaxID=405555 RepID=A0A543NHD9_9ACTN|nr:DUF397 domain-containing protein [Haloactinospora alba]TQN31257.1 uncharacterized protein DUF397 [Haloactinospora alba]
MKFKSSFSAQQGACVEVEKIGEEIHVTDSKEPEKPAHIYSREEWNSFILGAKNGEFDFE